MPIRIFLSLVLLIAAPLLLLSWVSASTVRDDRLAAEQQIRAVLRSRLIELDTSLRSFFDDTSRQLSERVQQTAGAGVTPNRELTPTHPASSKRCTAWAIDLTNLAR